MALTGGITEPTTYHIRQSDTSSIVGIISRPVSGGNSAFIGFVVNEGGVLTDRLIINEDGEFSDYFHESELQQRLGESEAKVMEEYREQELNPMQLSMIINFTANREVRPAIYRRVMYANSTHTMSITIDQTTAPTSMITLIGNTGEGITHSWTQYNVSAPTNTIANERSSAVLNIACDGNYKPSFSITVQELGVWWVTSVSISSVDGKCEAPPPSESPPPPPSEYVIAFIIAILLIFAGVYIRKKSARRRVLGNPPTAVAL
jgi:hypothetical protein